jgi:hypothetical protein
MSSPQFLIQAYDQLSSLYKNPTRFLNGLAASTEDDRLVEMRRKVFDLLSETEWPSLIERPAIYFKALSLLYEVDNYLGRLPTVGAQILEVYSGFREYFKMLYRSRRNEATERAIQAIACGVGSIESLYLEFFAQAPE